MAEESKLAEKLETSQNDTKFTEDEMNKLTEIKNQYLQIQYQFGQSAIAKLRLEEQIQELNARVEALKEEYRKNQTTEKEFITTINDTYGDGELNPETGVFTTYPDSK